MRKASRRIFNLFIIHTFAFAALVSLASPATAQSAGEPAFATSTKAAAGAARESEPGTPASSTSTAPIFSTPTLDSPEFATPAIETGGPLAASATPFSTIAIATDTPGLPPLIIPGYMTSAETAASDTLMLIAFFTDRMDTCMNGEITGENLDALLHAYMDIENPALQRIVPDTIECLAIAENNPGVCGKFNLFSDETRAITPYQSYISACESRFADFKMYSDAFTPPGDCESTLGTYCEQKGICENQPPGKICTCGLYAAMWCGIPKLNEAEACEGLKDRIRAELKGETNDEALIETYAENVSQMCKKAVLGFNPRLDSNDEGASQMLFFGGLYSGAKWPVYQQGGDPGSFGLATPYLQWYYTAYVDRSCLAAIGAFKKEFCYIAARDGAHADFAAKKAEEEKSRREKEEEK